MLLRRVNPGSERRPIAAPIGTSVRLRVASMAKNRSAHDCEGADEDHDQDRIGEVLTGMDHGAGQPKGNYPHDGDQQIQHVIPEIRGAVWVTDQTQINRCSSSTAHLILCHKTKSPTQSRQRNPMLSEATRGRTVLVNRTAPWCG